MDRPRLLKTEALVWSPGQNQANGVRSSSPEGFLEGGVLLGQPEEGAGGIGTDKVQKSQVGTEGGREALTSLWSGWDPRTSVPILGPEEVGWPLLSWTHQRQPPLSYKVQAGKKCGRQWSPPACFSPTRSSHEIDI